MEEFMRLYEKQKRLDEETKLKLATMQVLLAYAFGLRLLYRSQLVARLINSILP